MHPLVKLARQAVEAYVTKKCSIQPPPELTPEMKEKAGVFVCLKTGGELRGCIGTFMPCCENVAQETIKNSVCAATQDPRFFGVEPDELEDLEYSVDVLSPPEEIKDIRELDTKKYGIIVSAGGRKGLLLPDLEGVDTVEEQISIAKMKAGISPDEDAKICRFEVKRYK